MKGFYIYEVESRIGTMVDCLELGDIDNIFTHEFAPGTITEEVKMHALVSKGTKSKCSKDDSYDFEIGALIALMKMCGKEKVLKAVEELYSLKEPRGADLDGDVLERKAEYYEKEIKRLNNVSEGFYNFNCRLVDEIDSLRKENSHLKYAKSCNESTINSLENTRDLLINKNNELIEENKRLKAEKDLSWKNYQRNIQKKQDRINELERAYKASNDDEAKLVEYFQREIKNLEAENEKLKLDCEKLQHGYVDIDNVPSGHWDGDILDIVFLPGRACGKQYKTLVEMFKKIDQKKVDAAYKEAYGIMDLCPSWLDGKKWDYISIDEFAFKPVSRREQMWDDILKEGRTPIWVKREDIHDFLEECQATGIKWASGKLPLETMPFGMIDEHDGAYFFVMTSLDISKTKHGAKEFRHVMTWWATACPEEVEAAIHYIRPMRWDLFKKGRIAVKVNKENYSEFCGKILSHFAKVGISAWNHACKFGYFVFNKDTNYVEGFSVSDNGDAKEINGHKVVDWEEVR